MKTKYTYRSFRPWPEVDKRLTVAGRIGINVSELINEVLKKQVDQALKEKSKRIEADLKMVRGGGFEPPTPTVSR